MWEESHSHGLASSISDISLLWAVLTLLGYRHVVAQLSGLERVEKKIGYHV